MRRAVTPLVIATILLGAGAGPAVAGDAAAPETDEERTLYAMGLVLGRQVEQLQLSEAELAHLAAGLRAAALGEAPAVSLADYGPRIGEFTVERRREFIARNREAGREYLDRIESDGEVRRGPSGWLARTVRNGSGPSGAEAERVRLRFVGSRIDGTVFESSDVLGGPAEVDLGQAVTCWREAVAAMNVGETSRVFCPPDTAYGDKQHGAVSPGSTVVFELELLEILE